MLDPGLPKQQTASPTQHLWSGHWSVYPPTFSPPYDIPMTALPFTPATPFCKFADYTAVVELITNESACAVLASSEVVH